MDGAARVKQQRSGPGRAEAHRAASVFYGLVME
jgi:hypothetical protein